MRPTEFDCAAQKQFPRLNRSKFGTIVVAAVATAAAAAAAAGVVSRQSFAR